MSRYRLVLSCLIAALGVLPAITCAENLRVAVASNFAPVLEQLAPEFEKQSGHTLTLIAGATGQHYTQIINGAPFDVFLAADAERPQLLAEQGKAIAGSSFTYALGKLVLWSTNPELVDGAGAVLRTDDFTHLAIATPKLAPYGKAAQDALTAMGLWEELQSRIVQGENITQTLQFVQTGNAELGFIALAQWLEIDPADTGSHWEVPQNLYSPIVQQGVLLHDTPAGRDFFTFLQNEQSRAVITASGYELP